MAAHKPFWFVVRNARVLNLRVVHLGRRDVDCDAVRRPLLSLTAQCARVQLKVGNIVYQCSVL